MKFMLIVCIAFLARVKPVSTSAKPACMNMTRKPVTSSHVKLIPRRFWSTRSASFAAYGSVALGGLVVARLRGVPGERPSRFAPLPVVRPDGSPGAGTVGAAQPARSPTAPTSPAIRMSRRSDAPGPRRRRPGLDRRTTGSSSMACIDPSSIESVIGRGRRPDRLRSPRVRAEPGVAGPPGSTRASKGPVVPGDSPDARSRIASPAARSGAPGSRPRRRPCRDRWRGRRRAGEPPPPSRSPSRMASSPAFMFGRNRPGASCSARADAARAASTSASARCAPLSSAQPSAHSGLVRSSSSRRSRPVVHSSWASARIAAFTLGFTRRSRWR